MHYKHAMLLPAAALVMTFGMAAPSMAECDTEKLAEVVEASGVSGEGPGAAVEVVAFYADNACAVGRQDIAMLRGMMSDAYGAADDAEARTAALDAAKTLGENAGAGCDMDAEPLMVLDACTLEDVETALSGGGM